MEWRNGPSGLYDDDDDGHDNASTQGISSQVKWHLTITTSKTCHYQSLLGHVPFIVDLVH